MKTFLLTFLFTGLFFFTRLYAQPCSVANLYVEKVYTGTDGKCYADVFFDMERNNGNKFIYLHLWNKTDFSKVNKAIFLKGAGPGSAQINGSTANPHKALATVAIDNNQLGSPVWNALNYRPDATVPVVKGSSVQASGTPVSGSGPKALYRYSVKTIPLGNVGGGCLADNIDGVIWTTQANSVNSHIHCAQVGKVEVAFPLAMQSVASCANGMYEIKFDNTTTNTLTGAIDMYAGTTVSAEESFDPAAAEKFDLVGFFLVEPGQSITIKRQIPAKHLGKTLFSHVALSNFSTKVQKISTANCGTLPTTFSSFTAVRQQQQVLLKWQTASEQNVRGFMVQRRTASGSWKEIAFVSSKAVGGNSAGAIAYQHTDINTGSGVTEYRILETSIDGKTSSSETRVVHSHQLGARVTLYPNPTTTGQATLVFANAAARDIVILDMSGRTVKHWKNITSTAVQLENLDNGFYSVQITDRGTNTSLTEKLIVRK